MVNSMEGFDRIEVRSVVDTLLSPSLREQCFIGTYRRVVANISTLQDLKSAKHFQAISMLARSLFELAVDIRLLDALPSGPLKMIEFVDVEKLRCARKALEFKAEHPDAKIDTASYSEFAAKNASRIDTTRALLWPNLKQLSHWSGMKLPARIKLLKSPFDEIYALHYPSLSWQVHAGLTGIVNLRAETFTLMCGQGFKLAVDSYWEVLSAMIHEFKLERANEKIKGKMKAAKLLPFTDTPEQANEILRTLTGS